MSGVLFLLIVQPRPQSVFLREKCRAKGDSIGEIIINSSWVKMWSIHNDSLLLVVFSFKRKTPRNRAIFERGSSDA